jgi:hypothetical protein
MQGSDEREARTNGQGAQPAASEQSARADDRGQRRGTDGERAAHTLADAPSLSLPVRALVSPLCKATENRCSRGRDGGFFGRLGRLVAVALALLLLVQVEAGGRAEQRVMQE